MLLLEENDINFTRENICISRTGNIKQIADRDIIKIVCTVYILNNDKFKKKLFLKLIIVFLYLILSLTLLVTFLCGLFIN